MYNGMQWEEKCYGWKTFVELCHTEKEFILKEYFSDESEAQVAFEIRELIDSGVDKEKLYNLINSVMNESFYRLLTGLDGETALGNEQIAFKLYDEDNNLLNECGEIEENAYSLFMED